MTYPATFDLEDYEHRDNDAVMLVKELVSSSCLSQQPLVVLPCDYLGRITNTLKGMPRNVLADRARKEFRVFNWTPCK